MPMLICFVACGMLTGNIFLIEFRGYTITVPRLLTAFLLVPGVARHFRHSSPTVRPWLVASGLLLIAYEFLVHGLALGCLGSSQWGRSFSLLVFCVGFAMLWSRLTIEPTHAPALTRAVCLLTLIMGSVGVLQFAASNATGRILQLLPENLSLKAMDHYHDSLRFGELFRASGWACEPSYYGIGMVVLTTLCRFLLRLSSLPRRLRQRARRAVIVGFAGVAVSLSFTAWGVLAAVLAAEVMGNRRSSLRRGHKLLLTAATCFALFVAHFWSNIEHRWQSVPRSLAYRVLPSIDLMLSPGERGDMRSTFFGTGVGLESDSEKVPRVYERYLAQERESYVLVNGFAYIAITEGVFGLVLNFFLVFTAVGRDKRKRVFVPPILVLLIGYQFASGNYLSPEWWALLVFAGALCDLGSRGPGNSVKRMGRSPSFRTRQFVRPTAFPANEHRIT